MEPYSTCLCHVVNVFQYIRNLMVTVGQTRYKFFPGSVQSGHRLEWDNWLPSSHRSGSYSSYFVLESSRDLSNYWKDSQTIRYYSRFYLINHHHHSNETWRLLKNVHYKILNITFVLRKWWTTWTWSTLSQSLSRRTRWWRWGWCWCWRGWWSNTMVSTDHR